MRRDVKERKMTKTQLHILSKQTYQWWNAVFIQADRFFDVMEKDIIEEKHSGTQLDESDTGSMFVADRMFLLIALHRAIDNIQKLDVELQRENDRTFETVLKEIEKVATLDDIKNLRDMNEHTLDYLVDMGRKQDLFRSSVEIGDEKILTTAAWTRINWDERMILLGNVEIDKLIYVMKNQSPIVRGKTKEIFERSIS